MSGLMFQDTHPTEANKIVRENRGSVRNTIFAKEINYIFILKVFSRAFSTIQSLKKLKGDHERAKSFLWNWNILVFVLDNAKV